VPWKKVAQKFSLILKFSKKTPNNNNRPRGENLPNLVTLLSVQRQQRGFGAPD
jgi:hypothetical protein